ncbi:TonB family protein [Echinicola marina]|uniref:M56 family metallopeptidase n=1 Tax=Echinicola marina TaxID=2859768 RepID=UPI001CF63A79|nr:M56 family metallopeptidase [Echinicola marina]UCS92693.1 TonB family protein [Echinicola marina]
MAHLVNYIWQSTFCLLFFFGIYWCFLRGEKVFSLTRIFLLVSPVLALLFPLIEIPVQFSKPSISLEETDFLQSLTANASQEDIVGTFGLPEVTVSSTKLPILLEWKDYLFIGYLLIATLLACRLLWQLLQLRMLKEKGWYQTVYRLKGNYFFIPTFGLAPVFSFFDKLFWDDSQNLRPEEKEQIIKHEIEHIKQGHSWDMIYYQILSILFWFNPGIHLMRTALIDTHEYSADANVVKQTANKDSYTNLIVKIAFKGLDLPIGNHFIRSTTLKRIMMMKKAEKTNWFKLLMVIPLTAILLGLVSMKTTNSDGLLSEFTSLSINSIREQIVSAQDSINVNTRVVKIKSPKHYEYVSSLKEGKITAQFGDLQYEISNISDNDEYSKVLEMLSIFKQNSSFTKDYGIENLKQTADSMPAPQGGMETWNKYLSKNLKFPKEARQLGAKGTVYIEFVVDKEGHILSPSIKKSMGMGLDDEVLRMFSLESMPKWNPGMDNGQAINTLMVLPVKFKVAGGETAQKSPFFNKPNQKSSNEVFDVVEDMPAPYGGMNNWNDYLASSLRYPEQAKEKGIEGTVYVTFVVDKTGELKNPQILRGIGSGADEEALRVIKNADKWKPGKQNGTAVNVRMRVPIIFALNDQTKKKSNRLNEVVVIGYGAQAKSSPTDGASVNKQETKNLNQAKYFINGKEYDKEIISQISPVDIESINVLKGDKAVDKYNEKGKNGVVEITLKEGAPLPDQSLKGSSSVEEEAPKIEITEKLAADKKPLYVVDGIIYTDKEMKKMDPKNIASISVLKNGDAVNLYGSKAQDGVILITTKE